MKGYAGDARSRILRFGPRAWPLGHAAGSERAEGARRLLATNRYNGLHSNDDRYALSVKQEEAVDLLIAGKNDREAAESLGLHRVTVTRWRLYHPGFQALLHQRRRLVHESSEDGLRALFGEAVQAISDEIQAKRAGRDRLALDVIRALGNYSALPDPIGEADAEEIVEAVVEARHSRADRQSRSYGPSDRERRSAGDDLLRKASEPPPSD